jgi:hypothetical protein
MSVIGLLMDKEQLLGEKLATETEIVEENPP